MFDADARLEPLPVAVRQRHRGDRQVEDLASHPRDAVEALARRRVEQIELLKSDQALFLKPPGVQVPRHRATAGLHAAKRRARFDPFKASARPGLSERIDLASSCLRQDDHPKSLTSCDRSLK
ncbi:hypothetical protein [Methylobacterium tardum]|uniref:hypothetical protein n=1 Tax=Methylobacterium tardum TaxID=374432 RepID=UPI0036125339